MNRPEPLRVPPRFRSGLIVLIELPSDDIERIAGILAKARSSLSPDRLTAQLVGALPGIDEAKLEGVVTSVLSLYRGSDDLNQRMEDFISDLVQSPDLQLTDEVRQTLAARLKSLTTSDALLLTAKASGIATAHERSFHEARIYSDIRPIFGRDVTASPQAAVINHMLALTFHGASAELEEFYFAMSTSDLEELETVIKRAKDKAATLEALLRRSQVAPLGWGDE